MLTCTTTTTSTVPQCRNTQDGIEEQQTRVGEGARTVTTSTSSRAIATTSLALFRSTLQHEVTIACPPLQCTQLGRLSTVSQGSQESQRTLPVARSEGRTDIAREARIVGRASATEVSEHKWVQRASKRKRSGRSKSATRREILEGGRKRDKPAASGCHCGGSVLVVVRADGNWHLVVSAARMLKLQQRIERTTERLAAGSTPDTRPHERGKGEQHGRRELRRDAIGRVYGHIELASALALGQLPHGYESLLVNT